MKKIILCLAMIGLAGSAMAVNRSQLNYNLQSLTAKFAAMQQNPQTRVPTAELASAKGMVLLDRTKGGFVFAYHHGYGVALVRQANGHWSAPAFITSNGASLGFQAGGQQGFYVILLKTKSAADALTQQNINFGAAVGGTAGNESVNEQSTTASSPSVMVYSEKNGVFGGAAIKGGTLSSDHDADSVYYGKSVTMQGILFNGQVQPSQTEDRLLSTISRYSKYPAK